MTSPVFIIAECGSNWRFGKGCSCGAEGLRFMHGTPFVHMEDCIPGGGHLRSAYRMIRAAKECGADAAKFQWVSDYQALMRRRGEKDDEETRRIYSYVHFPQDWLPLLKAECDRVGIEFACTAYLPQDVAVIAPFVKRFKVAAKESSDTELRDAIKAVRNRRECIVSGNGKTCWDTGKSLWCVSKYPTPIGEISLLKFRTESLDDERYFYSEYDGLSDHTAHVLTGAVAVGAGARIIESHVRLHDTPRECPDYGHSLVCDFPEHWTASERRSAHYLDYVSFIRTAERMM